MKTWRIGLARVLVIFMVGIIVPTGFLVYLGVLSIKAETVLLKKESEDRVGKTLRAMHDQVASLVDESRKFADGLVPATVTARPHGVSFFIALDANQHLLFPIREGQTEKERKLPFLQLSLQQNVQAAEHAIAAHDFAHAQGMYLTLSRQTPAPYWKVKFLLKVAECLINIGRLDEAETQYQEILSRYPTETDEQGRPFGLLIILQLAELQMQEDRRSLAVVNELNAYQDLLKDDWKLSWDSEQFFVRKLQEGLAELGASMSAADHQQFAALNSRWRDREAAASEARDFMSTRWSSILQRIREGKMPDSAVLVFEDKEISKGLWVIPSLDGVTGERRGWFIAQIPCGQLWRRIQKSLDELTGASQAAYRFGFGKVTILRSHQKPGNSRFPLLEHIWRTIPPLTVEVGQLSDRPVQSLAERQRKIYFGIVGLSMGVILVALYATWNAVSREVELAQLKARFVASVSHELKTPLSIIGFIGQNLTRGRFRTEAEAREYYGILAEETDRLKSLIDDVLDFSRLLENRRPYRIEPDDLAALIRETIDRCRQLHPDKKIDITFKPEVEPCIVKMDREAIGRVILNLLDNAVKYSPPDRIQITLSLRREESHIVLEVTDKGLGFDQEEKVLIFERFYRGKSSMSHQKTNGVGLGLSIVQQIIEVHEGTIDVDSLEGDGSTFSVHLPL